MSCNEGAMAMRVILAGHALLISKDMKMLEASIRDVSEFQNIFLLFFCFEKVSKQVCWNGSLISLIVFSLEMLGTNEVWMIKLTCILDVSVSINTFDQFMDTFKIHNHSLELMFWVLTKFST